MRRSMEMLFDRAVKVVADSLVLNVVALVLVAPFVAMVGLVVVCLMAGDLVRRLS